MSYESLSDHPVRYGGSTTSKPIPRAVVCVDSMAQGERVLSVSLKVCVSSKRHQVRYWNSCRTDVNAASATVTKVDQLLKIWSVRVNLGGVFLQRLQ